MSPSLKSCTRALFALAILALAGCASQGNIHSQAKLADPAHLGGVPLAMRAGVQVAPEYWKQLGDAQLDCLIEEALVASPNLKVADSRIRRALAITDAAESALLPQVNADLDVTPQRFTEKGMIPKPLAGTWRTNNRLALDAGIELDVWGKYRRALEGAVATGEISKAEANATRVALSAAIARAYVEFDRLFRQRDAVDRLMAVRRDLEQLQAIRVKAGLEPDIDRSTQNYGIAVLKLERSQIEERIGLQRNLLAALAGQGPARGERLNQPHLPENLDAALPSQLPSDLLAARSDVLAARWRVEAAAADIDVAKLQFYPSVNMTAFLGSSSLGLDNLVNAASQIAGIGPAVKLPIFEGGRLRANLAVKTSDYDAAVEAYNATLVDALRDVADQARGLAGAVQQTRDQTFALQAAHRSVALVELRIARRLSNRVQWLGARLQELAQERVGIDLHAHRLDAALALQRSLGGGLSPAVSPFTLVAKQAETSTP